MFALRKKKTYALKMPTKFADMGREEMEYWGGSIAGVVKTCSTILCFASGGVYLTSYAFFDSDEWAVARIVSGSVFCVSAVAHIISCRVLNPPKSTSETLPGNLKEVKKKAVAANPSIVPPTDL